jgi:hypothetical protein
LNRTAINGRLNFSFSSSLGVVTFGFSGTVKLEYTGTDADAQSAADTDIRINKRFFSHGRYPLLKNHITK